MAGPGRGMQAPHGHRARRRPSGLPLAAVAAVSGIMLVVPDVSLGLGAARRTIDLAVTYDLPDSTTNAGCPGPRLPASVAERRRQNMTAAQLELIDLARANADRAAGIYSCAGAFTLTIHRVPGSPEFDAAVRSISARNRVRVSLVDVDWSRMDLAMVRQKVFDRSGTMAARGARVMSVRVDPRGFVEVGVAGDPRAARRVLSDVAARTRVVAGFMGQDQARRP
jgi:hypothetical protein